MPQIYYTDMIPSGEYSFRTMQSIYVMGHLYGTIKPKKNRDIVAKLLSIQHHRPIVANPLGKKWIPSNAKGKEVKEDRVSQSETGQRDRQTDASIHQITRETGTISQASLYSGTSALVETKGVPLVAEVGNTFPSGKIKTVMIWGLPDTPFDLLYFRIKKDKTVTSDFLKHIKNEAEVSRQWRMQKRLKLTQA